MDNNNKLRNLSLVSIVSTLMFFIWFTCRPGLLGTFHWHVGILCAYIFLCITAALPIIFGLLHFFKRTNTTKVLLKVFSIFSMTLWSLIFIGLTAIAAIPVDKKGYDFLTQDDTLPLSSKSDDGLIAHYAFSSDPHWGSGNSNEKARTNIMKNIDAADYDAFFCLGDISEVGMITSIYQNAVDDISTYLKSTPTLIMPGNHDGIVNGMPAFKKVFMNKNDELYFRMDNGQIHLLFIFMLWDDTEFSKKQEKWLIKQLEEIPQEDTVIVLSHCYVTGSGYWDSTAHKYWGDIPGVIKTICPILEKYNVDLSLSGHNHFFESLEKDDVSYMIIGSMGGKLDKDLIYKSPYSQWKNNTDFGYLDTKIYSDKIELTVYSDNGTSLYKKTVPTK